MADNASEVAGRADMDCDGPDSGGENMSGAEATSNNSVPIQKLACDRCRARKTRCDRRQPCQPCLRKQVNCTYQTGHKQRQRRQRTLVSSTYDDKIEDISKKLDHICSLVNTIGIGSSSGSTQSFTRGHVTPAPSSQGLSPSSRPFNADDAWESEADGESTLKPHATFATEFVQQVVGQNSAMHVPPEMAMSLDALRKMIDKDSGAGRHDGDEPPKAGPRHLVTDETEAMQLPPLQSVFVCLSMLKDHVAVRFIWSYEIDSVGQFMEYVIAVYSGKSSNVDLIIVNAGLDRLFTACGGVEKDTALQADYKAQAQLCRQNLEFTLSRLPFILPATINHILALCMAGVYYMDRGKPNLAWTFLIRATHMCQTLRLHQDLPLESEAQSHETRHRKIRLFWAVCLMEKWLAMTLGRPTTLRSDEITVPKNWEDVSDTELGMSSVMCRWIDIAMLQDRVYYDIYSPSALSQPDDVRIEKARNLAAELQKAFDRVTQPEKQFRLQLQSSFGRSDIDLVYQCDKISHLAILTVIYRSIPPGPYSGSAFSEECLTVAMQALEEHEKCISHLLEQPAAILVFYLQWSLLSAPFVPFIVIFCHTIETSNPAYLSKLASLVSTLKVAAPDLPTAYQKQCAIFALMYEVAVKYVEAKGAAAAAAAEGSRQDQATTRTVPQLSAEDFDDLFGEPGMGGPHHLRSPILRFSHEAGTGFGQASAISSGLATDMGVDVGSSDGYGTTGASTGTVSSGGATYSEGRVSENAGAALSNWFDQNQQIFRMLEDESFL